MNPKMLHTASIVDVFSLQSHKLLRSDRVIEKRREDRTITLALDGMGEDEEAGIRWPAYVRYDRESELAMYAMQRLKTGEG